MKMKGEKKMFHQSAIFYEKANLERVKKLLIFVLE
jgi:hypothetical protein